MREMLGIIGTVLGFLLVMLVIQFAFEPQAAQQNVINMINVVANIWHAATNAFGR